MGADKPEPKDYILNYSPLGEVDMINYPALSKYGVRYIKGDWTHTNLPDQSADVVSIISTFEHVGLGRDGDLLDESLHYAMDHEYWGRLARVGFSPFCIEDSLAALRQHEQAKGAEGKIPCWREELSVVDKWILRSSPVEREILSRYRIWLQKRIAQIRRRELFNRIPLFSSVVLLWRAVRRILFRLKHHQ